MVWRIILLLILSITITGCSSQGEARAPHRQPTTSPAVIQNNDSTANGTQNGKTEPGTAANPKPLPADGQADPIIVQSEPNTGDDTEAVLNDIQQELDNLTGVLKELETSDTAWDQEVNKP